MRQIINLLWASLLLAACAGNGQDVKTPPAALQIDADTRNARGLPAQKLGPNECGLFLWSKTDVSKFVFFAKAGAEEALFLMDDTAIDLVPVSEGGEIFGQFFTEMTYASGTGRTIALSYEPGETLQDGARISNGTIQFVDDKNWRTVLPVLGVRVCQPVIPEKQPFRAPKNAGE